MEFNIPQTSDREPERPCPKTVDDTELETTPKVVSTTSLTTSANSIGICAGSYVSMKESVFTLAPEYATSKSPSVTVTRIVLPKRLPSVETASGFSK